MGPFTVRHATRILDPQEAHKATAGSNVSRLDSNTFGKQSLAARHNVVSRNVEIDKSCDQAATELRLASPRNRYSESPPRDLCSRLHASAAAIDSESSSHV